MSDLHPEPANGIDFPSPPVTIDPVNKAQGNNNWLRLMGAAIVCLALIASACTNSDTTEASLDIEKDPTTTSTTIEPSKRSDQQQSNRVASKSADNGSTTESGSFVERPAGDSAYWTGATEPAPPTSATSQATAGTATATKVGTQTETPAATRTEQTKSESLGTQPETLAYTNRDYDVPAKSYVATVIGEGVSSLESPAPGVSKHWFPNPTQFGNERVFLVLDDTTSADYVKISLPVRPNGQEGWIPRDAVTISEVQHFAVVDLTDDSVTVWDGDDVILQTKAVTGKASTPTPVGQFFVRDIIERDNAGGAYGPYIVALSAFSEVLETFAGGLPAVAIHGTNKPWLIGGEHSSGCIRIPNDLIRQLAASVPPGTPVTIVS